MWDSTRMHTRVKLCEFEWLDPAYEAARLGADALGFHLFRRQNVGERLRRFARKVFPFLPAGVDRVLLTDLDLDTLLAVLRQLPADTVQLYPDWPAATILRLRRGVDRPLRILKVMSACPAENFTSDAGEFLARYAGCADGVLLDSFRAGGTGRPANWDHCAAVVRSSSVPVFLAGGLTAENVGEAINRVRPFGVDVETGVSDRVPGGPLVKNMAKVARFLGAVRAADRVIQ